MFKKTTDLFYRKKKNIEDEILLKLKINKILSKFVKEQIIKKPDFEYKISYTLNKGIVKIETDNKIIAQEIALRTRVLENELKKEGLALRKVLI